MATIQDINSGSQYTGNAALGGATDFGVTINPAPLDRLATFTYYRDRDLWQKKQQENAQAAKQIAMITSFDPNSPFKEYTEDLKKGIQKLKDHVRNNPNALYFDRDPKGYQQTFEMIGDLDIKRKHATANDVLWNAQKAKIETIPNRKERDAKMKLLEMSGSDLFKNGVEDAYRQQLTADPELKAQNYKVPTVPNLEKYTITTLPNRVDITGIQVASIPRLFAMSDAIYYGLENPLNENSPELKGLTKEQKDRAILEASVTADTKTSLDNMAATANELIKQYREANKRPDGTAIKVADIPAEVLGSEPTIGGLITLAKSMNETIDKINAATGEKNPPIDLDNGINAREIIALQTYGQDPGAFYTELKPQIVETNDLLEKQRIALGWAGLDWDKDKFALQLKGPEQTKSAAVIFAENLVTDIASKGSIKGTDGARILTPEDVRTLTADQLKWLGKELPIKRDNYGTVIESGGLQPLALADDEVLEVKKDGTIFVMKGAKFNPKSNKYGGTWDNSRSTSVGNVARLVLNEENTKSGSKEINNYVPIDVGSRKAVINVEQSGGGVSASGSSSTGGPPTYTKAELINGGWTEAQIEAATKAGRIKVN